MPQFLRASFSALPLSREKAQHKKDIKIFYHYQEEFSINFHIFIHKKYAHPISFSGCVFLQKANKKGALARTNVRVKAPFEGVLKQADADDLYRGGFCGKLFRYRPNTVFVSRMPAAVFMVCSIKVRIAYREYSLRKRQSSFSMICAMVIIIISATLSNLLPAL